MTELGGLLGEVPIGAVGSARVGTLAEAKELPEDPGAFNAEGYFF